MRKRAAAAEKLVWIEALTKDVAESSELLELGAADNDEGIIAEVEAQVPALADRVRKAELQRMLSGPVDHANAIVSIHPGTGGTDAKDWGEMMLRMYLRWCERRGYKTEVIDFQPGDEAGIDGASFTVSGPNAYGYLRSEMGVHRLVRISPFNAEGKRQTSFAAIDVSPEVSDSVEIEINPEDVREDTFRASGAGGQHVNKTSSAIRLTHLPTNTVVQCQSERSQHKNRDMAIKQLKAKLYEMEAQKKRESMQKIEDSKADIGWGSQIRSYVLDQSRIKDLRTGVETSNTGVVLDGDLDKFMEASLKMGL